MEIWKSILGYEKLYEISNLGNVKSLNYNHTGKPKILALKHHKSGYLTVMLCNNGVKKNKSVHVLVAEAFIENPNSYPCVNHIDGNKNNNNVSNLEWVTHSQNTQHAINTGLRLDSNMRGKQGALNKLSKPVLQYSKDGTFVKKWLSISEAARFYNCSPSTILNCCAGRIKSCKGYIWEKPESL
jgi:hypothetical protein